MKLSRRWFLSSLASSLTISSLTSCNSKQDTTKAAQVSQLVFVNPSNPTTFNYPLNDSAFSVFGFLYDGLISENGLTAELEPALAESWQISEDKKRITFTLREGLKWSDGEPLTADDVVFSYNEIYLNEKVPTGIRDILRIGTSGIFPSVKKLDLRQVEFSVPEPFAPFLRYAGGIPILPAHALQESVRSTDEKGNLKFLSTWGTDTDPRKIIGNSLYRMASYTPSERVIFERNPYYWRKDKEGNTQPYIERIVLQIIENPDTQLLTFRSGELDSFDVAPEGFSLLKREEKKGHYTIYNGGPDLGTRFLSFNLNQAKDSKGKPFVEPIKSRWFNTLAFRQAVAYAIDRETMKNTTFRGLAELQHSPLALQSPYYLSPEKGLKTYQHDPEKSKKILLDAGFKYNDKGQLLDNEGNLVRFTLLVKAEEKVRVDAAVQIQQDLKKIGIQADLQVINFNVIVEKLQSRNWEAYVGAFGGGGVEPHNGFNIWYSQGSLHQFNQGPQSGEPPIRDWKASDWELEIDRLFEAGVKELEENKRKEIYGKFQQIVQEQLPLIYLVNPLSLSAVRDRVKNIKFSALGGAFWNLYELKIMQFS
ncbi:MAG TPA: peptide ABC transporter substrate-binding protein [Cyanobacteria bacterium UBA11149]|nr:peptide ABC transporter substrate-binding protein [Cyanobacteria bacterium UBA11367]HBE58203.1 peptide ABC transporter substrate-binding protein [Cyanobacteria bacterium UBA11366]HBK66939.1 peptide ABC transporter substrate-binding protein [Cyanobacteria bacterium UBA11166]HBR76153.1 peptide ABC transporter substrate-binding protein [Cyanobacteria bacterium UBA11159]HBS70728.1 peptide ABC transporter substrate-binding protein [Cyanobacteria bacterium UBA11153]HBW88580.1 peptide ABC transpor